MSTTDLGACEWFVWDLRRSNLIDRGQLDQVIGEFLKTNPRAEPPELADYLVSSTILSKFQAERLLQGKTQGLVLNQYTLLDSLGSGSMGTVYKALNKNDNNWYAVKVLPRRSMWNVRIARRQVRAFEQCKHPAVVPFVDVGTSGGTHYLAWPLVEGVPLEIIVREQGKLDPSNAALYALQTADGLDVCHEAGLVHGLLKPSNIMISADNQVRILDFGIGMLLAESEGESLVDTMSTANSLTSGLDCGSPESILEPSNRTPAGDQYSLGCVLYYCLAGRYPFPEGTAVEKMMAHQMKQPTPLQELNPEVPDELAAVVERLMQKSPEARYPKTGDLIEALKPLTDMSEVPTRTRTAWPAPRPAAENAVEGNGRAEMDAPASSPAYEEEDAEEPMHHEPAEQLEPEDDAMDLVQQPVEQMEPEEEPEPEPPPPPPPPMKPRPVAKPPKGKMAPPPPPPPPAPPSPPRRAPAPVARQAPPPPPPPAPRPAPAPVARQAPPPPPRPKAPRPAAIVPTDPPEHLDAPAPRSAPLPTRGELFRKPPAPPKKPRGRPIPPHLEEVEDDEVVDESNGDENEGDVEGDEEQAPDQSLEERLGTMGIFILAILAAALTWLIMNLIMPKLL